MAPAPFDPVLVGAILGAFGVQGEARLRSFTAQPADLFAYGPLCKADGGVLLTPRKWRTIGEEFAVIAPEVASREAAIALGKQGLFVDRARLPAPAEDEFYHVDLIGLRAEALDGAPLGLVKAVLNYGAGDLLEIAPPAGPRFLVAFTKDAAPLVDLPARRLVIDPIAAGLGDPDLARPP